MPEIKLYNEDCIAAMKKIDDKSISLIVTDPPYNLGNFMKNRDTNLSKMRDNFFGSAGWDDMEFAEWEKSMDDFFKAAAKVMRKGGTMIVFMAIMKQLFVWPKNMVFTTRQQAYGIKLIQCREI